MGGDNKQVRALASGSFPGALTTVAVAICVIVTVEALSVSNAEVSYLRSLNDQMARCSCTKLWIDTKRSHSPSPKFPRIMRINRSATGHHGLRHETNSLQEIFKESLAAGRLLYLDDGPLIDSQRHNFGKPVSHPWTKFYNFSSTTFALFGDDQEVLCSGIISDCIFDSSAVMQDTRLDEYAQILSQSHLNPYVRIPAKDCVWSYTKYPIVIRDYEAYIQPSVIPGAECISNLTFRMSLDAALQIKKTAADILFEMKIRGERRNVVGIHVRRGDKVVGQSSVPHLNESTSSQNILRVVEKIAEKGTASLYVQTNEWDRHHFKDLEE